MGAHTDAIERAVLLIVAVILALGHGAFDAVIGTARILIHSNHSYFFIEQTKIRTQAAVPAFWFPPVT